MSEGSKPVQDVTLEVEEPGFVGSLVKSVFEVSSMVLAESA